MTKQIKTIQPVARQCFTKLERMALVQEYLRCRSSISTTALPAVKASAVAFSAIGFVPTPLHQRYLS